VSEVGRGGWDTRIAVHAAAGLALAGVLLGLLDLPGVTSERHRLGAAVAVVALAAAALLAWAWRAERERERALEQRLAEDVSRQRWMEAQLRMADRMASIGALAAGVAHEINNPLSYIASNVRFALDGTQAGDVAPAEVAEALGEALQGAARVREIVRDLRMLARSEESADQACDLEDVARTVANLVRHQLRDRAALEVVVPAGLAVAGSAGRIGQVLLNLLVNAAQAIEPGQPGRHRVALRARAGCEGRVVVEVEDTGHGIPAEHLARVFDPFFTTKPVGVGTGLGLSICQGIVASLGGAIQVESEPGRGTTFRLVLPARPAAGVSGGGAPASGLEVPGAGRLAREAACAES
jgi:signal transduction histidine kinase